MKQRLGQKWRPDFWSFVKFAVVASMCLFIVYPFYTIITKSVFSDKVEGVTLYNFIRFFTKKYYYEPLIRSIVVCSTTVLTSLLIGVPIAYVLTRYNVPGKILFSTFLGDFIEYEVELENGKSLIVNEYTKDTATVHEDGAQVHLSFDPNRISLYIAETGEVLSK